jgi:hypothetical protein
VSPDELRADADTLEAHGKRHGSVAGDSPAPEFETALESMRRLADVIEYAEPFAGKQFAGFAAMWDAHPEMVEVVRIARGETNERESNA